MKKEQIVNLIMNGGKTAKGKGRENLQEWGMEMIENYAKQKCKEQRELCQEELGKGNPKVRRAPEPKFD